MTFLYPLFEKGVSLFMENPGWQTVGFIAMFIIFYAFTIKDDTKLIKVLSISNIFWILHFFLLGNIWALIATIVAMIRLFLSLKYKKNTWALLFVAFLSVFLWYFSYEWYLSLIPIIATILASYWFFFLEKIHLRVLLLVVSAMWLYYHTQTWSMSGIINEIVVQWTICLTIYRFIYERERYSYDLESWRVTWKMRFLFTLKKLPRPPQRIDLWRFTFLRDKQRFELPKE